MVWKNKQKQYSGGLDEHQGTTGVYMDCRPQQRIRDLAFDRHRVPNSGMARCDATRDGTFLVFQFISFFFCVV